MYKWVQIDNNNVITGTYTSSTIQVIDKEIDMSFDNNSLIGKVYVSKNNIDEPTLSFDENKINKLKEVRSKYSELYGNSLQEHSSNEQATFSKQESEYEAWHLDNTTLTPTVDRIAAARGADRLILLPKIGNNIKLRDQLTGNQQAIEDKIKNCTTQTKLDGVII